MKQTDLAVKTLTRKSSHKRISVAKTQCRDTHNVYRPLLPHPQWTTNVQQPTKTERFPPEAPSTNGLNQSEIVKTKEK